METFGTALVGGLSGLQSMVAGATAGAAAGNLSMGNVSMDQIRLAPNRTSAFMSNWQNDISGNTFSSNMLTGRTAVSLLRNQGYASRVVSMRVSEQDVQDASRQVDAARSEAVAASTERSAVLSEAFTKGLAKLKSSRSSTGSTSSSFEQLGQTLNRLDQITRSVADSTGMSQSQVARIAFGASGHLGVSTPVAGARATANAEKGYLAGLSADQQRVLGALTSEQLAEFKQFGDRVSRDSSFASVVASDAREARELSSRLNSSSTRSSRAEAGLSDRSAYAERVSAAYERGEVIALDIAQDPHNLAMFTRYAEQYGGTSAAARALMEAELARQSLGPNRIVSDGTAVPLSFESLRTQHARQVNQLAEGPDIESVKRTGDAAVARQPGLPSGAVPPPSAPGTVRDAVSRRGQAIREGVQQQSGALNSAADAGRSEDGTLVAGQSLLKRAAKQVAADAKESAEGAADAVKDLLKRR